MTSPEQELEECLKDKYFTPSASAAASTVGNEFNADDVAFQCLPDFAETVAFLHQFGALFELSPFSFDDLAQALQQLHPTVQQHQYCPPNLLLDNLFAEILHYCGFKFDRSTVYNSLRKLIGRVNRWTPTPFDPRGFDDDNPKLSNLPVAQVLKLIVLLFDYLLQCVHEDGGLEPNFSEEQLNQKPLCADPAGRKFWYFTNDTWLFMEQDRPAWMEEETKQRRRRSSHNCKKDSPPPVVATKRRKKEKKRHIRTIYDKKKRRKTNGREQKEEREEEKERKRREEEDEEEEEEINITSQELDKACENLFTGSSLRPVCTRSDHFVALINAYRNQPTDPEAHGIVADKLEQCMQQVRNIEHERSRKAAERERERWAAAARMSIRVCEMMEKRRMDEEQMRARKERVLAEKRRLAEEEHLALLQEHRCLTDSDLRQNISREERHRLRQQRVDDQRERDQLLAAGLLEHDDNNVGTAMDNNNNDGDEDEEQYNMEEEDDEEDDDDEDEQWWKMDGSDENRHHHGRRQRQRSHPAEGQQRRRLLPVSRPIHAGKVQRRHCRFWRWAPEAPVPSKIATFAQLPSPSLSPASFRRSSPASTTATTAASECGVAPASFCLLMGEQQLPAEVKRKMSSFFAECSSMAASSSSSPSALFTASSPTVRMAKKTTAISSIRSVLQLPGNTAKW